MRRQHARAHDVVEPGFGHTPVCILVAAQMVVDVPGQMLARPLGVLVRLAVAVVIVEGRIPERGRKKRSNRKKWRYDQRHTHERFDLVAVACILFAKNMIILWLRKRIAAHLAVVVPVVVRAAAAITTVFVQEFVMREPFECVRRQKAGPTLGRLVDQVQPEPEPPEHRPRPPA